MKIEILAYIIFIAWFVTNNLVIQNLFKRIPLVRLIVSCIQCLTFVTVLTYMLVQDQGVLHAFGIASICSYGSVLVNFLYNILPIKRK